ncbi:hypothetical protein [Roseisolibacter sp. H3M3-2]|uniref:hypothetical protein n=1 Tax=Roseisolibacter sp. H3M3-2 TaxID=3031323 RepID=UPI0023DB0169|nr:hypothetical protein [Roseisolibacter sp. H3M3-2]MDF1504344.1 hypothetical protein [Roseisolibacter sp. H3M3-2]
MADPARRRAIAVAEVRSHLQRRGSPRTQMTAIVAATAGAGFVASYAMLRAGLTAMALRYPLALGVAYAVFLALVGGWLRRFRHAPRARGGPNALDLDAADLPARYVFGGAGNDAAGDAAGGWSLDLDEGALWLVPLLVAAALVLGVAGYVVYAAPALFAELLLDAGLAVGLYGRLARAERRGWLGTAVRGTLAPACVAAVLLGVAGFALQRLAPGAVSIGPATARLVGGAPAEAAR